MAHDNPQFHDLINAVQEAKQTVDQAHASQNDQQKFEAERMLALAEQHINQYQTEMSTEMDADPETVQRAKQDLDDARRSLEQGGTD
ncbi:hypothetical protein ACFO4N_00180 [Camelliibacillus cellulosilyticus]|uniref:Small, acid-soluble spore protein N n=1 Tax=Camelliibacillus cellulosilyticus TaxID=2174486 RepID=A0ABV9GG68_9BACL